MKLRYIYRILVIVLFLSSIKEEVNAQTISAQRAILSQSLSLRQRIDTFSTDVNLTANSDNVFSTQRALKTYIDQYLTTPIRNIGGSTTAYDSLLYALPTIGGFGVRKIWFRNGFSKIYNSDTSMIIDATGGGGGSFSGIDSGAYHTITQLTGTRLLFNRPNGINDTVSINVVTSGGGTPLGNPMTTLGDIIYGLTSGVPTRLGIGTTGQVLMVSSGIPTWQTLPGTPSLEQVVAVQGTTPFANAHYTDLGTGHVWQFAGNDELAAPFFSNGAIINGLAINYRISNTSYTVTYKDVMVASGTGLSSNIVYSLTSTGTGKLYIIKKNDNSSNTITITVPSGSNINGVTNATIVLASAGKYVWLISGSGGNYDVINQN